MSWDVQFSLSPHVATKWCVVRCTQDTQCIARLRFYRNIMEYANQDYRDLSWNIGAYNSQTGVCVTFSWPASSRYWRVSLTGTESSCGMKRISECRLRPVRTPVTKCTIIAALERKPWRSLDRITRKMGLWKQMILGTLDKFTCLRTTTQRSHICFQTIANYNCSFSYDCVINTMRMSCF